MTDTLTTIITNAQKALLDDGTNFSADTLTVATHKALEEFNHRAPIHSTTTIIAVAKQLDYELNDPLAIDIIDVLQPDPTGGENDTPVPFLSFNEDETISFHLATAINNGDILVRYTRPHTVSGLDGTAESTLPALQDPILLDGVCYHACMIRGTSRIETINLNQNVTASYLTIAALFKMAFDTGLKSTRKKETVGYPEDRQPI